MKKILITLLTILTANSFAICPDLKGNYTCVSDLQTQNSYEIDVDQFLNSSNVVEYHITSLDTNETTVLLADGKMHKIKLGQLDSLGIGGVYLSSSCEKDQIVSKGNFALGKVNSTLEPTMDGLEINFDLFIFIDSYSNTISCTLN